MKSPVENLPLDDLVAQFKQLENSGSLIKPKDGSVSPADSFSTSAGLLKTIFQKYGVYLILFVYTLVVILVLQPTFLYKKNDTDNKYQFLWKRFFLLFFVLYAVLVGILVFFKYYLRSL